MIKGSTLTLTGPGSNAVLEPGRIELPPHRGMVGLYLKFAFQLKNDTGAPASLTAAQQLAFLSGFMLNLSYGANKAHRPYTAVDFVRLFREQRRYYASYAEGYESTTAGVGLKQTVANGATANYTYWALVPMGRVWFLPELDNLLMVGPTQAKTFHLELKHVADTLPASWSRQGNVVITVIPDDAPLPKGLDVWYDFPGWSEKDEIDRVCKLPEGLPLAIVERTAVNASTALTSIKVEIDDAVIHDQVSPTETIIPTRDVVNFPAEGDLSDVETIIYSIRPGEKFRHLPSGQPKITQLVKNLATFAAGISMLEIVPESVHAEDVQAAATLHGNKPVRSVSLANALGIDWPENLRAFEPCAMVTDDDTEKEHMPGIESDGTRPGSVVIPSTVVANVKAAVAERTAAGELKAADKIVRTATASIPKAAQSGRGIKAKPGLFGSAAMANLRR